MNRKEPPEDNVPFLLGSLVGPIGRGEPGKCQEDETAAIKCHSSALFSGREIGMLEVRGPQERSPLVQFTPCGGGTCLQRG